MLITSNIRTLRRRFQAIGRLLPTTAQKTVNDLGITRFREAAIVALKRVATPEQAHLIELFSETVTAQAVKRGLRIRMSTPREAYELRIARIEQLTGRKRAADVPETLQQVRDAVREWVLTEKRLTDEEQANPEMAVARIWHLLGIHPDSTATSRTRQFEVTPDGRILLNPWGTNPVFGADLDRAARSLLGSTDPTGLSAYLESVGLGELNPELVGEWFAAVLQEWLVVIRRDMPELFRREVRRLLQLVRKQ